MRIQTIVFAAVAVLSLSSVACAVPAQSPEPSTESESSATTDGNTPAAASSAGVTGTCDGACSYYLSCKDAGAEYQAQCVESCTLEGYTSEDLASFQEMDCASAVAAIEGSQPATAETGEQSTGSKGPDCFSCQHDGSSCIYIGPMGGHSECDPSCC